MHAPAGEPHTAVHDAATPPLLMERWEHRVPALLATARPKMVDHVRYRRNYRGPFCLGLCEVRRVRLKIVVKFHNRAAPINGVVLP